MGHATAISVSGREDQKDGELIVVVVMIMMEEAGMANWHCRGTIIREAGGEAAGSSPGPGRVLG